MQVLQDLSVLGVSEDGIGMERLLEGKTLVVEERLGSFFRSSGHALVPALGADVGSATGKAGFVQDRCQGDTGPLAAGQDHPLLRTRRAGTLPLEILEVGGVAAGTLHDGTNRAGRETAHVIVVQAKWLFDLAIDGQ